MITLVLFLVGGYMLITRPKEVEVKPDVKVLPKEITKHLREISPTEQFRIPILLYHYVEYVKDKRDTIRQTLDIYPSTFEKQLQTLKQANYTFITAKDVADILDGKEDLPQRPVVLTFDDGYRDFYTDVFPLIKKYHVKVTAYIVPGLLGGPNYMDPSQVQEIARSGLVEVAAHTVHHAYLKNMSYAKAYQEIRDSKTMLEKLIHLPVVSFAYPYGAFDNQAVSIVKQTPFQTAVSTIPGIENSQETRYFLFRIRSGGRVGENLLNFLSQATFKPY